jgi:cell division protein FtsB
LDLSLPAAGVGAVPTSIGNLRLRLAGPAELEMFAELSRTLRGVELWRAFISVIGIRDADDPSATPAAVPNYELSLLSDDDLERTAEKYLDEVAAQDEVGAGAGRPPRQDGERSAEYAVRVLEAQLAPATGVATTIDKLIPMYTQPVTDVHRELGEIHGVLPDPPPQWDEAKRLVEEMRAQDDTFSDVQKRVEEIQDLLGKREQAWEDKPASAPPDDAPAPLPVPPAEIPHADGTATAAPAAARSDAGVERELAALGDAARANLRRVEQLQAVAEALTGAVAEIDHGRRRSDSFVRRAIVAGVAALALSCVLSGLALVLEYRHDGAIQGWTDSVQSSLAAQQQDLQRELARLSEERASFAARVEQLEAERAARAAEAARAIELAKAPEPAKAVEAPRPVRSKSGRSSRSSRSSRSPAR